MGEVWGDSMYLFHFRLSDSPVLQGNQPPGAEGLYCELNLSHMFWVAQEQQLFTTEGLWESSQKGC